MPKLPNGPMADAGSYLRYAKVDPQQARTASLMREKATDSCLQVLAARTGFQFRITLPASDKRNAVHPGPEHLARRLPR